MPKGKKAAKKKATDTAPKKAKRTSKRSAFPQTAIKRRIKQHLGKGTRVSKAALDEIQKELNQQLEDMAEKSAKLAQHGHRKTIQKKDVLLDGIHN